MDGLVKLEKEYREWREKRIEKVRLRMISILEAWGIPNPSPRPWEKRWEA